MGENSGSSMLELSAYIADVNTAKLPLPHIDNCFSKLVEETVNLRLSVLHEPRNFHFMSLSPSSLFQQGMFQLGGNSYTTAHSLLWL